MHHASLRLSYKRSHHRRQKEKEPEIRRPEPAGCRPVAVPALALPLHGVELVVLLGPAAGRAPRSSGVASLAFSRPDMTRLAVFVADGLEIFEDLLSSWPFVKEAYLIYA